MCIRDRRHAAAARRRLATGRGSARGAAARPRRRDLDRSLGAEPGARQVRVGEDLAADEAPVPQLPDPGDRDVADAELAAAGVGATVDQQQLAAGLDLARRYL